MFFVGGKAKVLFEPRIERKWDRPVLYHPDKRRRLSAVGKSKEASGWLPTVLE